jgi:phosphohistidine phosphatase SixA
VLLTSHLPRALATAAIASQAFGHIEPRIEPALAQGSVGEIVTALQAHASRATVAIVGHEPMLGDLLARLVGGAEDEGLSIKKGGAALVNLLDGPEARGRLIWFLEPRILRALAGRAQIQTAEAVGEDR